ncbi:Asp-tRNA(Asn)/Glu-tRNA(Gln) amidotransferase subunit GatA [Patescibacteria group bacterium]|nr:Asp-tRNA(Asn)/Glu-tRNA(Gln) amidotransferase subunit GatA [Patescibacteria group bacterium]
MNLNELTISKAHAGLKAGDFSAEELTRACLDRIKKRNKDLNAFIEVDEEGALQAARNVEIKTPLSGIPMGIKDIYCVKGWECTAASKILKGFKPPYDATAISKLRDSGTVLLGRTNMDEFACGASTEHSCFGPTKNPHDLARVPGGSSGGSAASVADDMCLGAMGTDTGGSVRQPASLCGCVGLKVTYGRTSRFGVMAMASSWDTISPFAKTTEDAALILQEIAGKDPKDSTTPDKSVPNYTEALTGDVRGLKIGVPKEYFGEGVEEETASKVMEAVRALEKAGAILKEVSLPNMKYAIALYYIAMPAELSANLARYDGIRFGRKPSDTGEDLMDYYRNARTEGFGEEIKRRIMIGTYVLSAGYYDAYYKKAQQVRTLVIRDFDRVFEEVDVLCGPVSPYPAFKLGENLDDPLKMYMADLLTIPASAAGIPGLSVPCGKSSGGLPIGLQIMGRQFDEETVLQVGDAWEKIRG